MSPVTVGFRNSTPLLDHPEELRARAAEDGFLFFRQLLDRDLVLQLRRSFLEVLDRFGWLDPSADLMDGRVNREAVEAEDHEAMSALGVGVHAAAYAEIQKLELFHAIQHNPRVLSVYKILLGEPLLPHPRTIARLMVPASYGRPTPSHQDFIHIQGARNFWSLWMPVGDCPREMGNLTVIRGSHKDGLLPVGAAKGAGGLEAHLCGDEYEWVEGDMQAGDAITFSSLTVHKSLPPKIRDRVRLSCDYRFQRADEEIELSSLRTHGDVISWEDATAGWKNEKLKQYWTHHDLKLSAWDESIQWQKEKIC